MNLHSFAEVSFIWVSAILLTAIPFKWVGIIGSIFGESIEFVFRSLIPLTLSVLAFWSNPTNRKYVNDRIKKWFRRK